VDRPSGAPDCYRVKGEYNDVSNKCIACPYEYHCTDGYKNVDLLKKIKPHITKVGKDVYLYTLWEFTCPGCQKSCFRSENEIVEIREEIRKEGSKKMFCDHCSELCEVRFPPIG